MHFKIWTGKAYMHDKHSTFEEAFEHCPNAGSVHAFDVDGCRVRFHIPKGS
jgi:hypothetical protein